MQYHAVAGIFPMMSAEEYASLCKDIQQNGLLEPVWTREGQIIDGRNRYQACLETNTEPRFREWSGEGSLLAFVISLNVNRRYMNETQRAMAAAEALPYYKAEAKVRMVSTLKQNAAVANLPQRDNGKARDFAATDFRVSPRLVESAARIREKAIPELYSACRAGHITINAAVAMMGESPDYQRRVVQSVTGGEARNVKQAASRIRKSEVGVRPTDETCTVTDLQKLIDAGRKFGTLYIDPPWSYGNQATRSATDNHYKTMSIEQIQALPVSGLAAEQSHLYLWTTNAFLHDSFHLLEAWGFEYKSILIWDKEAYGIGNYWRLQHEFLMLGIRNDLRVADSNNRSVFRQEPAGHSAKPEAIRKMIEGMSPGPYLEMFARRVGTGWTCWGNEIARTMFDADVKEVA